MIKLMRPFLATALCLTVSVLANAVVGGQSGNGGGGVYQNGRYMTFYSAGFYTEPQPSSETDIPSLDALVSYINGVDYLTDYNKARAIQTLLPSGSRTYYKVQAGSFDSNTRSRLIAEYAQVMHVGADHLVVYAVTDTANKRTYLLPAFYNLSQPDQMAILFHEAYWIMFPQSTYNQVVSAEMAFEAVYSAPSDNARIMNLLGYYGGIESELEYAEKADQQSGALKGLIDKRGNAHGDKFFGDDFLNSEDVTYLTPQIYQLRRQYPNSLLLQLLATSQLEWAEFQSGGNGCGNGGYSWVDPDPTKVTINLLPNDNGVASATFMVIKPRKSGPACTGELIISK